MNDKVLPLCAALMAALALPSAAYCQEQQPGQIKTSKASSSSNYLERTALIPVKLLAVGSAVVVGTPIAVVRHEARRLDQYSAAVSEEWSKDDASLLLIGASVPGQMLRSVGTVGEGIVSGTMNALSGWDAPFSDESFSLERLEFID